jgi:hypothetical protein
VVVILSRLIGESKGVGIDGADDDDVGDRDGDSDEEDDGDDEMDGGDDEMDGSDELRSQQSCSFLLLIPPLLSFPTPSSLIM